MGILGGVKGTVKGTITGFAVGALLTAPFARIVRKRSPAHKKRSLTYEQTIVGDITEALVEIWLPVVITGAGSIVGGAVLGVRGAVVGLRQ